MTKREEIRNLKEILDNRARLITTLSKDCDIYRSKNYELKKQVEEKDVEIDRLNDEKKLLIEEIKEKSKRIVDLNQQLTEQELFEKKMKKAAPTGVPAVDSVVERMCRLEAKFEAQQNPYFF